MKYRGDCMKIILYKNKAENNRLDKTVYLEQIIEMEGALQEECSLTSPSLLINLDVNNLHILLQENKLVVDDNDNLVKNDSNNVIFKALSQILSANYMYIPLFNRYYFISDISSVANHLWRITSNVDVLMSYKDQILETNAFVARNQNEFNKDIIDNECVLTDKEEVEFIEVNVDLFNDNPETPYVLTMIADY